MSIIGGLNPTQQEAAEHAFNETRDDVLYRIATDFDEFADFISGSGCLDYTQEPAASDVLGQLVFKERMAKYHNSVALVQAMRTCYIGFMKGQPQSASAAAIGKAISYFARQHADDVAESKS